jgi:hypothetical protein
MKWREWFVVCVFVCIIRQWRLLCLTDETTNVKSENVVAILEVVTNSYTPASSIKAKHPPANTAHERKQTASQGKVRNQYHQVMPKPKQYNKLVVMAAGDDGDEFELDDMPPILLVNATSTVKGNKSNPVNRAVSG